MKKKHLFISLIIIGLCFYYVFNNVSFSELGSALRSVNYLYLIPAVAVFALAFFFRALRWKYLIRSIKDVKTTRLFAPLMVGFMGNILPARAGEILRAYLLGKKEDISFSASFATIFIERLLDMGMILLMLLWILIFKADVFKFGGSGESHQLMNYMVKFGWVSFFGSIFIFSFSVLLQYKNNWAMKIVHICIKPLPDKWGYRVVKLVQSFTQGLSILRDRNGFLISVALSFLLWATIVYTYYPIYQAFNIGPELPILTSLIILTLAVGIFISVAPTPGFLGSFHAACVAVLHELFGIPKAVALSYGIVAWTITMGFIIVAGTVFVLKDHISLKEFSGNKEATDPDK